MIFLLTWTPGAGFRDALKQAARNAAAGYNALYDSNGLSAYLYRNKTESFHCRMHNKEIAVLKQLFDYNTRPI